MGKLQTFFWTFVKSATSPHYYAEVVRARFSFSLKFFFFFFFLYALVANAFFTPTIFLPLNREIKKLPDKILAAYPSELEIKINDGQATTNVKEPYSIPFPIDIFDPRSLPSEAVIDLGGVRQPMRELPQFNLLTIDTKGEVMDINKYKTLAFLTKENLVIGGEGGELRVYSLKEIRGVTINKLTVFALVQEVAPYLKYVLPLIIFFTFLGLAIIFPLSSMVYLLFFALLLLLVGKLIGTSLSYKKYYQISLHTMVLWTTLEGVMYIAKINVPIPFWDTFVLLTLTTTALWGVKKAADQSKSAQPNNV